MIIDKRDTDEKNVFNLKSTFDEAVRYRSTAHPKPGGFFVLHDTRTQIHTTGNDTDILDPVVNVCRYNVSAFMT